MARGSATKRLVHALAIIMLISRTSGVGKILQETDLLDNLFAKYNPLVRPVEDSTQSVMVRVSYFLHALGDVDERAQTVNTHGFLQLHWTDEFLTWKPSDYAGIKSIFLPVSQIWVPDLLFDNGVTQQFYDKEHYSPRIFHNGMVIWEVGGEISVICDFSVHDYPFDKQECKMVIVTWAGTDDHIKLYGHVFNSKKYMLENSDWSVFNTRAVNYSYDENGESFSQVHLYFEIERKPLSDVLKVVCPVLLLSVLNGMVFLLPAASGEKVGTALTLLLSFTVLQYAIDQSIPSQSDSTPILDIYITMFIVSSSVVVMLAVLSVRMNDRDYPLTTAAKMFLRNYNKIAGCLSCSSKKKKRVTPLPKEGSEQSEQIEDWEHELQRNKMLWAKVSIAFDRVFFIVFCIFFTIVTTITFLKLTS